MRALDAATNVVTGEPLGAEERRKARRAARSERKQVRKERNADRQLDVVEAMNRRHRTGELLEDDVVYDDEEEDGQW